MSKTDAEGRYAHLEDFFDGLYRISTGRWITGAYAIPSERDEDAQEAEDAARKARDTPPEQRH